MAGLRVGQAYGGVPPTWVWVVGVSPQILEHPASICDTGVNLFISFYSQINIFLLNLLLLFSVRLVGRY